MTIFKEISHHGVTWIGAAVFGKSKSYMYSDQSPYGHYANWRGGMIPRINPARRCIKMDRNGYWFQSCCKLRSISVCKKPATLWESTNDLTEFRRSKFRKF
ncbi:hypothetical protein DICVIV_00212 [Dictyocaulus viviparus]|uniref:C-type lectin domain-containing protein n=1 Tax=Dictyocaulus viviparus TaxID=29172 RepID=A0A0D8YGG6_DICVI|nr:hypothetical protein DICVIV_00212 [Dictyocaulus viviparus]